MRNLKKILALSLVFAMVFSLSFSALAVTRNDFADKGELNPLYNGSVDLLLQLGILQGKPGGNLDPTGVYTRAEMAYLTAAIMLGGNISAADPYTNAAYREANGIGTFSDVSDSDWYAGALYYLVHTGIVSGTGNGTFNPSGNATRLEVAAFALGIIGYKKDIQGYVGNAWTLNVQRDAAYCGLYTDISASETNITREQVFKMMDNALMNDSIDYNPVTGQSFYPTDSTGKSISVLQLRFKQYARIEGLFIANQYVSLDDGATEKGRVRIINAEISDSTAHTAIIDNVNMAQAPVAALGREVAVYAKKTNVAGRFDGLLGNVIPTDEIIPIGLSSDADDFDKHAERVDNTNTNTKDVFANLASDATYTPATLDGATATWVAGFKKTDITDAYAVRQYGNNFYTYVFRNTWSLLEISAVADGKVTAVQFGDTDEVVFEAIAATSFENGENLKVGDVVMAILNGDSEPITAQPVENLKANLSSRTGYKVTLSGAVYAVIESKIDYGDFANDLLKAIVDAGNYGVQRDYYVFTNPVTEAENVVGYRGPAAAGKTYCVVLDKAAGNLNGYGGVQILMEDGSTGIYALTTLKTLNTPYDFTSTWSAAYTSNDGKKATTNNLVNVVDATTASNNPTTFYEYVISDDGSSVVLTEADTTGAYTYTGGGNAEPLEVNATYTKGNSYINNTGGEYLYLTNDSLIFAKDGAAGSSNNYYCFKGRTASSFDINNPANEQGVFAQGKSGELRFAYVEYAEKLGIGGNFGVLTSDITVSGNDKNITLSFKMFDLKTGTNKEYTVSNFKDNSGTVLTNGTQPTIKKGSIIEYTTAEDGVIKSIDTPKAGSAAGNNFTGNSVTPTFGLGTGTSLLESSSATDDGWYSMYIGNSSGFNAYVLSHALATLNATPTSAIALGTDNGAGDKFQNVLFVDGDTLVADLRKSDTNPSSGNANSINNTWKAVKTNSATISDLLTNGPAGTILGEADDMVYRVDVKLSYDATLYRFKVNAIVIRGETKLKV